MEVNKVIEYFSIFTAVIASYLLYDSMQTNPVVPSYLNILLCVGIVVFNVSIIAYKIGKGSR